MDAGFVVAPAAHWILWKTTAIDCVTYFTDPRNVFSGSAGLHYVFPHVFISNSELDLSITKWPRVFQIRTATQEGLP